MAENEKTKVILTPMVVGSDEFWQGFRDKELPSYKITTQEKLQFLQYPSLRAVIRVLAYPILSARLDFSGDEKQVAFLKDWFSRYYRNISKVILNRAFSWGMGCGEKVYDTTEINGKNALVVKGIIAPEPYNIHLLFESERFRLKGFMYSQTTVEREKMAYFPYQGDEVSNPYGTSVVDDVAWAMDMLFKDWVKWAVYKKFKAINFLKVKYPVEEMRSDGQTIDKNQAKALDVIKKAPDMGGITIPMIKSTDGNQYISAWDAEEISFAGKTSDFIDSITKEESLLFVGALVPRKLLEQEMVVGSYGMLVAEADYFVQYVLNAILEDYEEHLRGWVVNPMLGDNFGSVRAGFNLKIGDEKLRLFVEIIKAGIQTGACFPDYDEMMDSSGMPRKQDVAETQVETHRHHGQVTQYQSPRRQIRRAIANEAEKWVKELNPKLVAIKEAVYGDYKQALTKEMGKVALRISKIFESNMIKAVDLRRVVQIPRTIYSGTLPFLIQAWNAGMKAVIDKANEVAEKQSRDKEAYLEKPNLVGLRKVQVGWEGAGAPYEIAGEGESLEKKIFTAILGINDRLEALKVFDGIFQTYIKKTVPQRIGDMINSAAQRGVLDAIDELNIRRFQKLSEGAEEEM